MASMVVRRGAHDHRQEVNGHETPHYGKKQVKFRKKGEHCQIMSVDFEVTSVMKHLVAVRRIADRGNVVHLDKGWRIG